MYAGVPWIAHWSIVSRSVTCEGQGHDILLEDGMEDRNSDLL